jgi:hypothetical protein
MSILNENEPKQKKRKKERKKERKKNGLLTNHRIISLAIIKII